MSDSDDDIERLRAVTLLNSRLITAARENAEHDLTAAREALAAKVEELDRAARERKVLLAKELAARKEAERLSALKDEFLSTLSHELRTPLSAILGWAQVLRRGVRDEADLQAGLEAIERNARAQAQLIEDMLDMSRITAGKVRLEIQQVQPISFVEAAIETVQLAADAKGIRIERSLDPTVGPVSGDPGRLQQIVWNLLSNAIKFTPKRGRVQVVLRRANSHVEICISDTGVGIKPEFIDHVFERFRQGDASSTRTHGGLGLGLSIVNSLVEMHGGTVRASSAGRGQGATFTVLLPLAGERRRSDADRPDQSPPVVLPAHFDSIDLAKLRVLVVDDEADACALIQRVLTECNAQVRTAQSAVTALRLIEVEVPDLLVSDLGMPDVDGFEFMRRVRELGAAGVEKLPAIAVTAFAGTEDRKLAVRAGFAAHITKPVDAAELIATVAAVAGRAGKVVAIKPAQPSADDTR